MEILYPVIYPTLGYYIRYRYEKIYIFPTTGFDQGSDDFQNGYAVRDGKLQLNNQFSLGLEFRC